MTAFRSREDRESGLDLRRVSFGDEPVVSRIYFAVRDPLWRTVGLEILTRERVETDTGFEVSVRAVTTEVEFPLEVSLNYRAIGSTLDAVLDAVATGPFEYARIGFCVLLDSEVYAGRPSRSLLGGSACTFSFPDELVTPTHPDHEVQRFHRPFDRLVTSTPEQIEIDFQSMGARFEMEDQRNWTDASYKIYSASDGWPHKAHGGERFRQCISVTARTVGPRRSLSVSSSDAVEIGDPSGTMPSIARFSGRLSSRSFRPIGGFHELNSRRLTNMAEYDSIELPINGSVHAADDDSVLEAARLHGRLVMQSRDLYPGVPLHLAPVSMADVAADWRDPSGDYAAEPPSDLRATRLLGPIAATWLIASVASAAPHGPDSLHYFSDQLPADTPAARALARLGELAGAMVLSTTGPSALSIVAAERPDGVTLAVANTSPDLCVYRLPDGERFELAGFASRWHQLPPSVPRR